METAARRGEASVAQVARIFRAEESRFHLSMGEHEASENRRTPFRSARPVPWLLFACISFRRSRMFDGRRAPNLRLQDTFFCWRKCGISPPLRASRLIHRVPAFIRLH